MTNQDTVWRILDDVLVLLAGQHYPTPERTYKLDGGWSLALADLKACFADLRAKLAAAEAERDAARAGEARAVEALRDVLIGLRADLKDRNPEDYARHGLVEPGYCEALQDVTDGLEEVLYSLGQPALDWLAQQRREAAAEALESVRIGWLSDNNYRPGVDEIWRYIADRAAALWAGEVGNE